MKIYFYIEDGENGMKDVITTTEEREGAEPICVMNTSKKGILEGRQKMIYNQVNNPKLPDTFIGKGSVHGCVFKKIEEGEHYYIYQNVTLDCYEVFRKTLWFGGEIYPYDHSFGEWAWCCKSLEKAKSYIPYCQKQRITSSNE